MPRGRDSAAARDQPSRWARPDSALSQGRGQARRRPEVMNSVLGNLEAEAQRHWPDFPNARAAA